MRLRNLALATFVAAMSFACSLSAAFADGYRDFNQGVDAYLHSDNDAAIKYLSAAVSEPDLPKHLLAPAYLALGKANLAAHHFDASLAAFDDAIKSDPTRPDAHFEKCEVEFENEMYSAAVTDCTAAIQLQPDNFWIRYDRLICYERLGQFDNAIADFSTFIAAHPKEPLYWMRRADVERLAGKYDAAMSDANASRDLSPNWPESYFELGLIAYDRSAFATALDDFQDVTNRDPGGARGYIDMGETQWAMGNYADAASSFQKALDRNNLEPYAFVWLSITEAKLGASVPADIVKRFTDAPRRTFMDAIVLLYLGKANPTSFLNARGESPADADSLKCEANFYVGEWYFMKGDTANGTATLQNAVRVCIGHTKAQAAIELARTH